MSCSRVGVDRRVGVWSASAASASCFGGAAWIERRRGMLGRGNEAFPLGQTVVSLWFSMLERRFLWASRLDNERIF